MAQTPDTHSQEEVSTRSQLQAELQRSEQRFHATFEQAAVGMAHVGLDGRWLEVNQKLCDIIGYTRTELLAKSFQDITYSEDKGRDVENLHALRDGERETYVTDKRYVHKNGSPVWVYLTVSLARDEDRQPLYFVSVIQDISERKHTEEENKLNQERLKMAQRAGSIGSYEWDIAGQQVIWTPELEALYGLPAGGFGGKYENWVQSVHPDDLKKAEESLHAVIEHNQSHKVEFRVIWPDGTVHWLLDKGEIVDTDAIGRPTRMIGVNIDITERKEVELQLERALEQVDFLSEASRQLVSSPNYLEVLQEIARISVPVIADWCRIDINSIEGKEERRTIIYPDTDSDTQELGATLQLEELDSNNTIRYRKRALVFSRITDNFLQIVARTPQEQTALRAMQPSSAMIAPLSMQGQAIGNITFIAMEGRAQFSRTDLSIVEELASRISLAIENVRIYQSLQDLNARLEELVIERTTALRQSNTELQRSNQELQDFAYVASHDLQEPLRKIQAFGDFLEDEYGEALADGKTYLDRMRSAASRMQILINDLLTFSRVTTKAQPFSEVDLNTIAQDVVEDLETRIKSVQGTVELGELPRVEADPLQMRQMFQNLIGNALKFHKRDTPALVKVYSQEEDVVSEEDTDTGTQTTRQARIFVEDNGIGFDEKYLDRIFTVFQRLHGRGEYEGTGIGLAVVRKIVERHEGTVTARSTTGQGATFIVTLPIQHTQKEEKDLGE